jgi:hypothetical protein
MRNVKYRKSAYRVYAAVEASSQAKLLLQPILSNLRQACANFVVLVAL